MDFEQLTSGVLVRSLSGLGSEDMADRGPEARSTLSEECTIKLCLDGYRGRGNIVSMIAFVLAQHDLVSWRPWVLKRALAVAQVCD